MERSFSATSLQKGRITVKHHLPALYIAGIAVSIFFGIAHIIYAFFEFERLDEPALWFFSGALTLFFNAGLNVIHLNVASTLIYRVTLIANVVLAAFCILLAIVSAQIQTLILAFLLVYMLIISIRYHHII